jgi:hypothetical protein
MTLTTLIEETHVLTGWPKEQIRALVVKSWPSLERFTATQQALLVDLIERKERRK